MHIFFQPKTLCDLALWNQIISFEQAHRISSVPSQKDPLFPKVGGEHFEVKWFPYRASNECVPGTSYLLISRNHMLLLFPQIPKALSAVPCWQATVPNTDGELKFSTVKVDTVWELVVVNSAAKLWILSLGDIHQFYTSKPVYRFGRTTAKNQYSILWFHGSLLSLMLAVQRDTTQY